MNSRLSKRMSIPVDVITAIIIETGWSLYLRRAVFWGLFPET